MRRELVIAAAPGETRAMIVEDGVASDLHVERSDHPSLRDAVFLGRVDRVVPALPGCFVDIGLSRPAFLPVGTARGLPTEGARLVVQVVKDAHDDKPAELTRSLSLPGRYANWTPGHPGIRVANAQQRSTPGQPTAGLLEAGEGIRLLACDVAAGPLAEDLSQLRERHRRILSRAETVKPPSLLESAPTLIDRLVRDPAGFDRVRCDDRGALADLRLRLGVLAEGRLEFDATPGFEERTGLADAFDAALAPMVAIPEGGNLRIDTVAACTAIDVNLGTMASGRAKAAQAVLSVNLAAAKVLSRQLRLRNLAGAIIVDFVSMKPPRHRDAVERALAETVASDPLGVRMLGWTGLGHYELTRPRRGLSLDMILLEPSGTRHRSAVTVALEAIRRIAKDRLPPGRLGLRVHPTVARQLETALQYRLFEACAAAGRAVVVEPDPARPVDAVDLAPIDRPPKS